MKALAFVLGSFVALSALAAESTQIEFETKFLEVSPEEATALFGSRRLPSILPSAEWERLLSLIDSKAKVDLVSAPKVTTKAGLKATVKIVRVLPFATAYAPPDIETTKTRVSLTPSAFENREVGFTIEMEPEVAPDGRIIARLKPSFVELLGYIDYGEAPRQRSGSPRDALSELLIQPSGDPATDKRTVIGQPIFHTREIATDIVLRPGETILLGGLSRNGVRRLTEAATLQPPSHAEPSIRLLYFLVTMRSIAP